MLNALKVVAPQSERTLPRSMKNTITLLLALSLFAQVESLAQSLQTWNSRNDFSSTQGGNDWYYLEHDGDYSFTEMTFSAIENEWVGTEAYLSIGSIISHPGNTKEAVRKWTSPKSFRIKITGTVNITSPNGDGVIIKFKTDPTSDWQIPIWQKDIDGIDTEKKNFDRCIWIEEGESIYFSINKNSTTSYDAVDFNITIEEMAVIELPHLGITDHSNATIENSIAWHFSKPDSYEKTYKLVDLDRSYVIKSELRIPKRSSLINGTNAQYVKVYMEKNPIDASNDQYFDNMLSLDDESSIKGLRIDSQGSANRVVNSKNKKHFRIDNCAIFNSRNNYTNYPDTLSPRADVLYIKGCQYVIIKNNILRNAGYVPSEGGKVGEWPDPGRGELIMATDNNFTAIVNNNIANALTHGITIGNSSNILLQGNDISNTGRNREYLPCSYPANQAECSGYMGDGIGGYHATDTTKNINYTVRNNTIFYSGNHGIHVAGKNVVIENSLVRHSWLNGIKLSDWRNDPTITISENCLIKGNNVALSAESGLNSAYDIKIDNSCYETIAVIENIVTTEIWFEPEGDKCKSESSIAGATEEVNNKQGSPFANSAFELSPNPVDNALDLLLGGEGDKHIVIFNTSSQKMFETSTSQDHLAIDVSGYKKGLYTVSVNNGEGIISRRIVVK